MIKAKGKFQFRDPGSRCSKPAGHIAENRVIVWHEFVSGRAVATLFLLFFGGQALGIIRARNSAATPLSIGRTRIPYFAAWNLLFPHDELFCLVERLDAFA
jgi:hypothetical protein